MKKTVSVILLLLTVIGCLSACSGNVSVGGSPNESGSVSGSDPDSAQTGENAAAAPPSEYVIPYSDYKDADFCIAALSFPANESWHAMDYCEVSAEELTGETLNDAIYERSNHVESELHVKLSLFPLTDRSEAGPVFEKEVMAGDSHLKMAMMNGYNLASLTFKRVLLDQKGTELVDFSHSWWDPREVNDLAIGGSLYASTGDISLYLDFSQIVWYFNKALIEDLQLDNPYELVYNNEWTIDRAAALAKAASLDLNGDGRTVAEDDQFGLMCEPLTLVQAIYAADIPLVRKDDDGMPYIAFDPYLDRAAEVAERLVPLMNDRAVTLLNIHFPKVQGSVHFNVFLPTFMENRALFYSNQLLVTLNLRDMDADFGILPYPKYDETQEFRSPIGPYWATFAVVPASNKDYDMTGEVMEALGYYGQQLIVPAFVDKSVRYRSLRDEDSSNMLNIIFENRCYDLAMIYNCGQLETMFSSLVESNSANVSSMYASIKRSAQNKIDQTVKKLMR